MPYPPPNILQRFLTLSNVRIIYSHEGAAGRNQDVLALPRDRRAALFHDTMTRIGRSPGVRAVGAISTMFYLDDEAKFGLRAVEGRPLESRERWTPMTWATIIGDYFQALGVPLVRGPSAARQPEHNRRASHWR